MGTNEPGLVHLEVHVSRLLGLTVRLNIRSPDNRTAGFRIVGAGKALRIECRIPGADVNPYLAFAGSLAAGLEGTPPSLNATGNSAFRFCWCYRRAQRHRASASHARRCLPRRNEC